MVNSYIEVDEALFNYLQGIKIDGKPVPVAFASASAETANLSYPSIVIMYMGDSLNSSLLYLRDEVKEVSQIDLSGRPTHFKVTEAPTPLNFMYGIRVYTNSLKHNAELKTHLRRKFSRDSYIMLNGRVIPLYQISYRNPSAYSANFGERKRGENREFIEQYLIRLPIRLNTMSYEERKVVDELNISIGGNNE